MPTFIGVGAFGLVVLLFGLVVVAVLMIVTRVRPVDVDWVAGGYADPASRPVYETYLRRHWRARAAGGLAGLVVAVIAGYRWQGELWLSVGVGNGPISGDLLVGLLAGATIGTLGAETYRLRGRRGAKREARLEARPPRPRPGLTWAARILVVVCVVAAVVALTVSGDQGPIAGAVLTVVIVALAEVTQIAITDRPRFTDDLMDAVDHHLRIFSGTSVAWLEFSGAVLGFAWSLAGFDVPDGWSGLMVGVELACLIVAFVALWRSSGHAPRGWRAEVLA